jgi:hypothetical protein
LTEVEGNVEQLKKLLRKEYQLDALQTLEIVRRIDELPPIPRIVETYQEFGGSLKAINQMLIDEFPDLPKSRYGQTVDRALRVNDIKVVTVPSMRKNPRTKKPEPIPNKEILFIGSEDILIPEDILEGHTGWEDRTSWIPSSENEGRFLERIAGRNHAIFDWLYTSMQEHVTNLTNHQIHYRDELKNVYGSLIDDKGARAYIMHFGEGLMPPKSPADQAKFIPVAKQTIETLSKDYMVFQEMKARVYENMGQWEEFTQQSGSDAYQTFVKMILDEKTRSMILPEFQKQLEKFPDAKKLIDQNKGDATGQLINALKSTIPTEFTSDDLKAERPKDWEEIERIATWHREQYEELFKVVNVVRERFGLGAIPYRKNYMTHVREEGEKWRKLTGLDFSKEAAGRSAKFIKRKTNFNPHALERLGERTRYDSLLNFEDYLEPTLRQIHLTEAVVRHRAVARALQRKDLKNMGGNVARYVDSVANELARQRVGLNLGEILLNEQAGSIAEHAMLAFNARVAGNSILGNLATAIMQTVPMATSAVMIGPQNMMGGVKAQIHLLIQKGVDISDMSPFLTRRYGYEGKLSMDWYDKYRKFIATPMNFIEEHTVRAMWTGAHFQANQAGKSAKEAIEYADLIAERVVGGRAIGEQSPIFRSAAGKLLLPFQYEVSNFNQFLRHDLPYDHLNKRQLTRKETLARAATLAVLIYAANSVYELLMNRRPIPDVIETAMDMVGIVVDPDADGFEKIFRLIARPVGELLSATAGGSLVGPWLSDQKPILGSGMNKQELFGDTEFGTFSGGVPLASNVRRILEGDNGAEFAWNLTTILGLPGGGSQIRKTTEGAQVAIAGERTDKSGKTQFEVSGLDTVRALLFGPWGTGAAQEWLDKKREKQK